VSPVRDVAYMRIPVLFLHGTRDVDVPPSHSDALFNNYGSEDKCLLKVDQGHNSLRPADTNEQIARFLAYRLSGSLVGYRELLGNAASDQSCDSAAPPPTDDSSLLPSGWSSST